MLSSRRAWSAGQGLDALGEVPSAPGPPLRSDPVGTDPSTGRQPLRDRLEGGRSLGEEEIHALQRQVVDHLLAPPLAGDQAAVAQTGEVGADPRLGLAHLGDQLPHRHLAALEQQVEDPHPGGIAEHPEESGGRHGRDPHRYHGIHIREAGYHPADPGDPRRTAMARSAMRIEGMTCAHCEKTVAEALTAAGAQNAEARWQEGLASFETAAATDTQLRAAIEAAGYRVATIEDTATVSQGFEPLVGGRERDYDLVVLGSGSAAFAAAIRTTDSGFRVALLESNVVGGTCVNVGCVPSKALLAPADAYFRAGHPAFAGIRTSAAGVDLGALVGSKAELVEQLRADKYLDLARDYGFTICHGRAEFIDSETVECGGERIRGRRYLIATGASPAIPPIEGLRDAGYLTSTTVLELRQLPKELAVIGANAIGLEMGQLFLRLGSRVTFLEAMPRITPLEEPEVSETMTSILEQEGASILAGVKITSVSRDGGRRRVAFEHQGRERRLLVDEVLVATGRRPNTAGLGLERAGIEVTDHGAVRVDEHLRTTNPRVFAAGDVTGHPQFVYVAAYEGNLAARNALEGDELKADFTSLPRVIFTTPTVAAAGLTDEQANAQGIECECCVLPLSAVPRALVNRDTRGFVKIVAERASGRIVGATAVANGAGDVIQAAVYAIQFGLTTDQVASAWAPYLTFAEAFRLAAQTFTRDVAKLSCCAA